MALDPKYVAFENFDNSIFDKDTGEPLANGIVSFFEDLQRLVPKEVFRLSGVAPDYTYTSLGSVLRLSDIGTFIDGPDQVIIYGYPYDEDGNIQRYYITIQSEGFVPQYTIEAAPANLFDGTIPPDQIINGDNELNNSQFVEVSFNPGQPHTFTFSAAINQRVNLAPDWELVVSGTGSVTVERIALTELDTPTNPPYVIDINSNSINNLALVQRFTNSPRLIAEGFVSGYFIAASQDGLQHALQMLYVPSGGSLDNQVIIDETIINDGSYNVLQGNLEITGTINPDPASTGYVDLTIIIPVGAHIRVSSFQLVQVNAGVNIEYGQISTPKQINTLFSYYKNSMQYMPKDSMTPWWKFGLNPRQFFPASNPIATQCSYIFDQTILYQAGAGSKVNVLVGPTSPNGVLQVQAASGASDVRFALITYVAPQSIQGWWGYWMSTLARANLTTTQGSSVRVKVRLIYRATLPSTIGAAEPIASWAAATDPTFSAGWTAVTPLNDPAYALAINANGTDAGNAVFPEYPFDQMQMPLPTAASTNMIGLVFYTYDALDSTPGDMDVVNIDEISLVPNQFAVASTPLTFGEVLLACQQYYQSSYPLGVEAGALTTENAIGFTQRTTVIPTLADTTVEVEASFFQLDYVEKCISPDIIIFNPTTGATNSLEAYVYSGAALQDTQSVTVSGEWVEALKGKTRASFVATIGATIVVYTGPPGVSGSGNILLHATIDSRLGK